MNAAIIPWPHSLHLSAAVGDVARALYVAHHAGDDTPPIWDTLAPVLQQNYLKHAAMALEAIVRESRPHADTSGLPKCCRWEVRTTLERTPSVTTLTCYGCGHDLHLVDGTWIVAR